MATEPETIDHKHSAYLFTCLLVQILTQKAYLNSVFLDGACNLLNNLSETIDTIITKKLESTFMVLTLLALLI